MPWWHKIRGYEPYEPPEEIPKNVSRNQNKLFKVILFNETGSKDPPIPSRTEITNFKSEKNVTLDVFEEISRSI